MSCIVPEAPPDYAYETCGLCNGDGKGALGPEVPCPLCKGCGRVVVYQPSIRCARCDGNGRATTITDGLTTDLRLCVICKGAGWLMARLD